MLRAIDQIVNPRQPPLPEADQGLMTSVCETCESLWNKVVLNVATFLRKAVHVAFLLRHSIKKSRIRTLFNGTLRNGAPVETDVRLTACFLSS